MSIGLRLHDAAPGTLRERAEAVRAQGFQCVHLALSKVLGDGYMEPAALTPGLAAEVGRALAPLDVAVLGCYLNLACPDERELEKTYRRYEAHLRFAARLGAGVVGTETGNPNAAYRYDPAASHTDEALALFIDRLRPVARAAEKLGALIAIEPVYTHIVCDARRARRVLDEIASPCLRVILDPVNLLHPDNLARRDGVIAEALELLGESVAVLHVKDYTLRGGAMRAAPVGTGEMDYAAVFRYVAREKPGLFITLENTTPATAEACRRHVETLLARAM